ncbi:MAG: NHL repeat-containing protein [Bacillota bacterium]
MPSNPTLPTLPPANPPRLHTSPGIYPWVVRLHYILLALLFCRTAFAAPPIPADKRIEAHIIQTISAPADQPMHMPTDVALDSKGHLFVADGANNRILRFTPDGKLNQTLGQSNISSTPSTLGSERSDDPDSSPSAMPLPANVQLNKPVGIAIDSRDQLWIADTGNHRLVLVSADATKAEPITPLKIDDTSPFDPTDLVVTPDGQRTYIVDNENHRILVRENATSKWSSLGAPGRALGQFQWPFMICIGQNNYLYVAEAIGARVQQITPDHRWAGQIGRWGVELGQFYRPKGLAADPHGRLFVSDSTLGVIQVFSARGMIEGVLTDKDGRPLRFEHPMGMAFDRIGHLYVVELRANRVAVVSVSGEGK